MKNQYAEIAATVTVLDEVDGSPESLIYMALGMDIDRWNTMRSVLLQNGLITIANNYVRLTANGRGLARKLHNVLAKAQAGL